MNELPNGWEAVPLEEVITVRNGYAFKSADFAKEGVPVVKQSNLTGSTVDLTDCAYVSEAVAKQAAAFSVKQGDLILGMSGSIGEPSVYRYEFDAVQNQRTGLIKFVIDQEHHRAFIKLALVFYERDYASRGKGIGVQNVSARDIEQTVVPLPPLPEQKRIVAQIDSLSSKSKRAREHLDHLPRLVEKYKQAALAAAFRGDLTKEWRQKNAASESPSARLSQLAVERTRLAPAKPRPKSAAALDSENGRVPVSMGKLPATWAICTLEKLSSPARLIQYGILKPGEDFGDSGVPYVKVLNIRGGKVELAKIRRTSPAIHAQYQRSAIREGDILLTIRGTVGRLAFVPAALDGGNITQDSVRIDVLDSVNRSFVFFYLMSPAAQEYFSANQKGVAVRGINVGDVRPMEIPLPPHTEQQEIVRRIEHALNWIDRLASEAGSARKLVDRLDQTVLAKAFAGELVPQDPTDEPASALLERIRTQRNASSGQPQKRRARSIAVTSS